MTDLVKIALDAMGGDNSPNKIIDGVLLNHKSNKNVFYKIFGDENKINNLIDGKINKEQKKKILLMDPFNKHLELTEKIIDEEFLSE